MECRGDASVPTPLSTGEGAVFKFSLQERGVGTECLHRKEREEGRLANQKGRSRGSRVATEDSPFG